MPVLHQNDLDNMNKRDPQTCSDCNQVLFEKYCRSCDQFYGQGHTAECPQMKAGFYSEDHDHYRPYYADFTLSEMLRFK